ncbi:MAG: ELM1/GtrOC1 family putative glycosyltransferase [Candidatus Omnitrophota bacterium]
MVDYIVSLMAKTLGAILRRVPFWLALYLGRRGGDMAYLLAGTKRKSRAYADMKAALGDELTPAQLHMNLRRLFWNLGEGFIELLWFPNIDEEFFKEHIKIVGAPFLVEARKKSRGIIFLTAHFGNWELLNLAAAIKGYPIKAIARMQKMKRTNELLNHYREMKGCQVVFKDDAKREILKALKEKELVGILGDQSGGGRGVYMKFFQRKAPAISGSIALAQKTGAIVLPTFIIREKSGYHRVEINEPLKLQKTSDNKAGIKEGLKNYLEILERYIRKYPDHWLWLHRRWKATSARKIVVLNDGRAGHLNQSMAVKEDLEDLLKTKKVYDEPITVSSETINIKYKSKFHRSVLSLCSIFTSLLCQGCLGCVRFALTRDSYEKVSRVYADFIISAGSYLAPVNVILSKETAAKNIMIMRPSVLGLRKFSLVIAPRHDGLKQRRNVAVTRLSPARFDRDKMKRAAEDLKKEFKLNERPKIGFFLGGDADSYRLAPYIVKEITARLKDAAVRFGNEILATTSRRTSKELEGIVEKAFNGVSFVKVLVLANKNNRKDIVSAMLGLCDVAVISTDSFSMISEALNAGVRVIVYGDLNSRAKYARIARGLVKDGLVEFATPVEIGFKIETIRRKTIKPKDLPAAKDKALIQEGLNSIT